MTDVAAVDGDPTVVGLVKAEHQFRECALAAARGAGEDSEPAGFERKVEVAVEERVVGRVAEGEIQNPDLSPAFGGA